MLAMVPGREWRRPWSACVRTDDGDDHDDNSDHDNGGDVVPPAQQQQPQQPQHSSSERTRNRRDAHTSLMPATPLSLTASATHHALADESPDAAIRDAAQFASTAYDDVEEEPSALYAQLFAGAASSAHDAASLSLDESIIECIANCESGDSVGGGGDAGDAGHNSVGHALVTAPPVCTAPYSVDASVPLAVLPTIVPDTEHFALYRYPLDDDDVHERLAHRATLVEAPRTHHSSIRSSAMTTAVPAAQRHVLQALDTTLAELRSRHAEFRAQLRNAWCAHVETRTLLRARARAFEQRLTRDFLDARERSVQHAEGLLDKIAHNDTVASDRAVSPASSTSPRSAGGQRACCAGRGGSGGAGDEGARELAPMAETVVAPRTSASAASRARCVGHDARGDRGDDHRDDDDDDDDGDCNQYHNGGAGSEGDSGSDSSRASESQGFAPSASTRLKMWLFDHFENPYPSERQKHQLMRDTGLSYSQLNNWFINARVRVWRPAIDAIRTRDTEATTTATANTDEMATAEATATNRGARRRAPMRAE